MKLTAEPAIATGAGCSAPGPSKHSLKAQLAPVLAGGSRSTHSSTSSDPDEDQSPPVSPLRSPHLSSSSSSISSWGFSSSQGSQLSMFDDDSNASSSSQCNSKEDRATYNTKFARYHLETYRQNDKLRWNFDFDHNRPLDDGHHHHHQTTPRYQWEPTI